MSNNSNLNETLKLPVNRKKIWPSRRVQLIETVVFLFLILPSMSASFLIGSRFTLGFSVVALLSILNDLGLMSLVFYFIWRNGEPLKLLGWTSNVIYKEIGIGLLLFLPIVYSVNVLEKALQSTGLSAPSKTPSFLVATGHAGLVLAVILVIVAAIVEETIFRGYLILRLKSVIRNPVLAVVISSIIFSIGHGYEGIAGVISVFFLGIIFAVIYIWRVSLIAPMIIHFLIDFSSIVLSEFLKSK